MTHDEVFFQHLTLFHAKVEKKKKWVILWATDCNIHQREAKKINRQQRFAQHKEDGRTSLNN